VFQLPLGDIVLDLSSACFPYFAQCADACCATEVERSKFMLYSYDIEFSVAVKVCRVEQPESTRPTENAVMILSVLSKVFLLTKDKGKVYALSGC